jgi:hypothetical protein
MAMQVEPNASKCPKGIFFLKSLQKEHQELTKHGTPSLIDDIQAHRT